MQISLCTPPKMNSLENKKWTENFYISIFHTVTPARKSDSNAQLINESKLIYT